jgi:hydrogenase large subunit
MAAIKIIDPVTRIEGHLKIEVTVDTVNGVQQVVDAWATGTLFRGFEKILIGRHPADAQHITERICGVCPVSHGMAAVLALESAYKVTAPSNARLLRNLVLGSNFLQSHILHFYHLALPDFVEGPDMPPWQPSWKGDKRFSSSAGAGLLNNYLTALTMRRKAHEMGAIYGGRLPHPPSFLPGGITATATTANIADFKGHLTELIGFINGVYLPDVELLASQYDDYFALGAGSRNLLAFGVFDLNSKGSKKLLKRGRITNAASQVNTVNVGSIGEQVGYSWYADNTNNLNPAAGDTLPQYPKTDAYSWLKAPRYAGLPYETGPLARMWVNGDYRQGISVMDRHRARAAEALKVALAMQTWIKQVKTGKSNYTRKSVPVSATSYGLTEAPRGALGHWLKIAGSKIAGYQVITPTCWNASPRDGSGQRGPIEQALIGTPVQNIDEPTEVVRVIHSFDPCLSCAVHVMRPAEGKRIFTLGHYGEKSCLVRESE